MTFDSGSFRARCIASCARAAGLAAAIVGCVVLIGWTFDLSGLKSIQPGWETMKANSALAFVMAGGSLWLQSRNAGPLRRQLAWAGAGAVLVIGLLTVIEYLVGWNLIDEWLFQEPAGAGILYPGRMAPLTALNFILLSVALVALDVRRTRFVSIPIAIVLITSFVAVVGYAYGMPDLYGVKPYSAVALHTALTFLLLGLGILCSDHHNGVVALIISDGPAGLMLRRTLPAIVLVLVGIGWLLLFGQRAGLYQMGFASALLVSMSVVVLIAVAIRIGGTLAHADRQRNETYKALRESEGRFRSLADTAPVMIWMSGADRLCTFFNRGWLDFTGRTLEQELGYGWSEGVHPEDKSHCFDVYTSAFDARQALAMEYRLRRSDGQYRWIVHHGMPRFAAGGSLLGYVGSAIDITAQKEADMDIQSHRAELARLTRIATMGELTASLTHELRQPLTAIRSNAEAAKRLLERNPHDVETVREILEDIVQSDRHAAEVIRRMHSLIKREPADAVSVDAATSISNVVRLIKNDAVLRNIHLSLDLAPGLPPVSCNEIQLQQVVLNLLLNAFDAIATAATGDRRVLVRTELDDEGMIRVLVQDSGTGLRSGNLDAIFTPFYTTKREGLGVGLSISRSIVEAHGGRIWCANNPDRGATFYFTLLPTDPLDATIVPTEARNGAVA